MLGLILLVAMIDMGDGVSTDAPVEFIPDDAPALVEPVPPPVVGPPIDPATATAPQGGDTP
jgi:hypothetical protein